MLINNETFIKLMKSYIEETQRELTVVKNMANNHIYINFGRNAIKESLEQIFNEIHPDLT